MFVKIISVLLVSLAVSALEDVEEIRAKRSPEGNQPWELKPQVGRDQNGNTITDINVKRKGDQHDFEAGWSKVVDGPNRAKPTWHVGGTLRWRRSIQPHKGNKYPWEFPNPGKGQPNWNLGGHIRFRRSPDNNQPWELKPQVGRDENGNTITDINVKRKGDQHDFEAGWSKVVNGPNKAKPTWHVGGTLRWRRSAGDENDDSRVKRSPENDQPWELKPQVGRDQNGNTIADVNVKRKGDQHDFEAGWSKVVNGPNRAKPTWHVGGTLRWRRSLQPHKGNKYPWEVSNPAKGQPNYNLGGTVRFRRSPDNDQPWELKPQVGRDENGNTVADVNVKRSGEQHDFEAGWSKVVDGPNRAKPTWHVGGTFRWRRSADHENVDARVKRSPESDQPWELKPQVGRDENGNTIADINVKRNGDQHDFEAGWSKVVNGPNRAKPTWHVGGTFRWRRSAEPYEFDEDFAGIRSDPREFELGEHFQTE